MRGAGASDPRKPRDAVVHAGRSRLLSHALDTVRSQLNASTLASVSPVSRDTAYRVFRDHPTHSNVTDAIVAAVGEAANDPDWAGYHGGIHDALVAYQTRSREDGDGDAVRAAVIAALRANFEAQFRSPGLPVGWLLQAAALTSSPAWEGEGPPNEDVALGQEILEQRRRFYQDVNAQLVSFLTIVLSEVGRRPRLGVKPEHVIMLVHALLDGAVLRNLIEPGALSSCMVAEAMYGLAMALTEEGALVDPRRPTEERAGQMFDRLVGAAGELWRVKDEITVEDAAGQAGVPQEAACLLFPTVGDLADSLIRARVVGGGFTDIGPLADDADVSQRLVGLVTELRNLREFADQCPRAVAVAQTQPPSMSSTFIEDFVENESRVVAALGVSPDPVQLVTDLAAFACRGSDGWPTVIALLHTIGYKES
jgi:hypothetical protein